MTYYAVQYNMKGTWKFVEDDHGPRLYDTVKGAKVAAGHLCNYGYYVDGHRVFCDRRVVEVNLTFKEI